MNGIYCLLIHIKRATDIGIGALGTLRFQKGLYCYVGSAQRGIEHRVRRHLSKKKTIRWHIDYLLDDQHAQITHAFAKEAEKAEECRTAEHLIRDNTPVTGFGCSDCKCKAHLFLMQPLFDLAVLGLTPLQGICVKQGKVAYRDRQL
jgi:Uri superfamily endonuclease